MKKKLLLFFALIATFVCLFAITSSATPVDGIYYTFTKTDTYENYAGTAMVNGNNRKNGTLTNVVIPEIVEYDKDGDGTTEKYVVTAIDGSAFGANGGSSSPIVSVYVPKTVASIGTHVFRQLQYLETVTIDACGYNPETGATSELSFSNAEFWGSAKLTTIDMSKSLVTSLGGNTCHGCSSLTTVYLSPSTKSIADSFKGLESLTTVTGLENVETFGEAFYGCALLTGDFVFNKVKSIGTNAFRDTSITSVDMSNAPLVTIYDHAFNNCKSLTTVKLPTGGTMKEIQKNAFRDSSKLTSMNIPRSMEIFGNSAFWGCKFGGDVVIDNLTGLADHAFRGTNITSFVALDGTITSAGSDATFYGCSQLAYVVLPDTVESIGQYVFTNCSKLKYIVASENITSVNTGSGVIGSIKAIILTGSDPEKLATAAAAFGGTLASFDTYNPSAYPSSRTVYYGVETKDNVNYYKFTDLESAWCTWNATTNEKVNYKPVVNPVGYSIKENAEVSDGIIAGFLLDQASREAYEGIFGEISLGVFMANANEFTGDDFIVNGVMTNTFGVQLEITAEDYSKINCTVVGMSAANNIPPIVFALYALDSEGNVIDYVQKDYESGAFANTAVAGENTLTAVTLSEIEALLSKASVTE